MRRVMGCCRRTMGSVDDVNKPGIEGTSGNLAASEAGTGGAGSTEAEPVEVGPVEVSPVKSRLTESVWDYPRPPRLEATPQRIRIMHAGVMLADSTRALRILETSHPPVYYVPQADIAMGRLRSSPSRASFCEFKGVASYWSLEDAADVAWSYAKPSKKYEALKDHLAFYASRVEECWVNDERVVPQEGDFYGGWITSNLRGPFKGAPGTRGW